MKTIVIYKSNTGFTKKYAEWIAEALSCEAVPMKNSKAINLSSYDALVFGGWFFAGSMQGLKEIKEQMMAFKGKKAVFVTGAMPPNAPGIELNLSKCFRENERENIETFYMPGGLDYEHMGFVHKSMMKMMSSIMKKQHGVDSEEYKTVSQSFDATNQALIEPLVRYIGE